MSVNYAVYWAVMMDVIVRNAVAFMKAREDHLLLVIAVQMKNLHRNVIVEIVHRRKYSA